MNTIKFTNYDIHDVPQSVILYDTVDSDGLIKGSVYHRIPYAKKSSNYITINGKSYAKNI